MPFGIETIHCNCDAVIVISGLLDNSFDVQPQKTLPENVVNSFLELNSCVGWKCCWVEERRTYMVWQPRSIDLVSAAERIAAGLEEMGLKVKRLHLNKECQSFILA